MSDHRYSDETVEVLAEHARDLTVQTLAREVRDLRKRTEGFINIADGSWISVEHRQMIVDAARLAREAAARIDLLEMKVKRMKHIGDTLARHVDTTHRHAVAEWEREVRQ